MQVKEYGKNSGRELIGWEKVRPARVAFFVDKSKNADLVLDAIFADSYGRWGGRFSLIVPCNEGRIMDDYWPWLDAFDPDIVYSYVEQDSGAVLEIHERLAPGDYIRHATVTRAQPDAGDFRPRYDQALLSSMSTVFRLARHSPLGQGPKVKVIDSWHTEKASRLLMDNLGICRASGASGIYPNDAQGVAGLLTIVADESFHERRNAVPQTLDRIPHEYQAFKQFANGTATGMSLLSAMYAPRMEVQDQRWSTSFNLVVGDSFEDRLLFWNARLSIPSWLDGDICCFRITMEDLDDLDFPKLLAHLINTRNHVNGGTGGQPQLRIRSATHDEDTLKAVLNQLHGESLWNSSATEIVPGGHAIPALDALRRARETTHGLSSFHRSVEGKEFQWTPPLARLPSAAPEHLRDAPPGQAFTLGCWAVDLRLEHGDENFELPRYTGIQNEWILPKRWRMAGAFKPKFEVRGMSHHMHVLNRTNRDGNLTIFAGVNQVLKSLEVPTVREAMQFALCRDAAFRRELEGDPPWPKAKAQWIDLSNEANYLIGVLGLTGGLARARDLLLHPFLQTMLADLGGTPNVQDSDVLRTANALAKRTSNPMFNLAEESDRTALSAFIAKAAQSIKAPRMWVGLEQLRTQWNAYRANYYEANPQEVFGDEESNEREKRALEETLGEMRTSRMLFQGYPWKCGACQHRNWTDFQSLKPTLACDVCSTGEPLPIAVPWHFRANEFLIESLRSHSVLSLVWLLAVLGARARNSFLYLEPTRFYYRNEYERADAEADLLAVVDGQTVLCEIKSAWRSLRKSDLASFVALAVRLRPDRAILAVMAPIQEKKLGGEIESAASQLRDQGIQFELLTLDAHKPRGQPFLLN